MRQQSSYADGMATPINHLGPKPGMLYDLLVELDTEALQEQSAWFAMRASTERDESKVTEYVLAVALCQDVLVSREGWGGNSTG